MPHLPQRTLLVLVGLLAGCTSPSSSTPAAPEDDASTHRLVAHDATLRVPGQGLVVHAAQATLSDAGDGTAQEVRAQAAGLEITSLRSEWRFADRTATFQGEVVAVRGDATLRCETLTVALGSGEQIRSAVAQGGVTITQQGREARARSATLDGATGKVTLEGEPSLSETGRRLEGHLITLWLDDERVECASSDARRCRITLEGEAIGSAGR